MGMLLRSSCTWKTTQFVVKLTTRTRTWNWNTHNSTFTWKYSHSELPRWNAPRAPFKWINNRKWTTSHGIVGKRGLNKVLLHQYITEGHDESNRKPRLMYWFMGRWLVAGSFVRVWCRWTPGRTDLHLLGQGWSKRRHPLLLSLLLLSVAAVPTMLIILLRSTVARQWPLSLQLHFYSSSMINTPTSFLPPRSSPLTPLDLQSLSFLPLSHFMLWCCILFPGPHLVFSCSCARHVVESELSSSTATCVYVCRAGNGCVDLISEVVHSFARRATWVFGQKLKSNRTCSCNSVPNNNLLTWLALTLQGLSVSCCFNVNKAWTEVKAFFINRICCSLAFYI